MVLFHGNDITLTPASTRFDFSDTPADGPRDTGCKGSDGNGIDDFNLSSDAFPFARTSESLEPLIMAKTRPSINNPEKTMSVAFLGGLYLAGVDSAGRGLYEHGRVQPSMLQPGKRDRVERKNKAVFWIPICYRQKIFNGGCMYI